MKPLALGAIACFGVGACHDLGMDRQPKFPPQAPGRPALSPPAGTVSLGRPAQDAAALQPPVVDLAVVERGRERHGIACAPCHGAQGEGGGSVVQRGFPRPPDYGDAAVQKMSGRQIYDVITDGYGVMLPQAERLTPADRWAVVAYVRALQLRDRRATEPRS